MERVMKWTDPLDFCSMNTPMPTLAARLDAVVHGRYVCDSNYTVPGEHERLVVNHR